MEELDGIKSRSGDHRKNCNDFVDPSHISDEVLRQRASTMLEKYSAMWEGNHQRMVYTEYIISLMTGVNPVQQMTYSKFLLMREKTSQAV